MATHSDIARAFARGTGPKRAGNVYREPFDWPSRNSKGDVIYSYGSHFPMAIRNDVDKIFLINGDRYGHTTDRHQSYTRSAIAYRDGAFSDYKTLTVPFSIFRRAYNVYDPVWMHVKVIDVGKEKEIIKCHTCDKDFGSWEELNTHKYSTWNSPGPKHKTQYFHQLAPSTFSASYGDITHYFINGFDETANQRNHDGYFLSELPHKPKNIAHAYEMLKPRVVKDAEKKGLKVLRQGDIFAIPTDLTTRRLKIKADRYEKGSKEDRNYWGATYKKLIYPRLLTTSHVATEVATIKDTTYARGVIRHRPTEWGRTNPEHRDIPLGKAWHRIARNTALASYSTGGRVD